MADVHRRYEVVNIGDTARILCSAARSREFPARVEPDYRAHPSMQAAHLASQVLWFARFEAVAQQKNCCVAALELPKLVVDSGDRLSDTSPSGPVPHPTADPSKRLRNDGAASSRVTRVKAVLKTNVSTPFRLLAHRIHQLQ